jgi:aspartate racemase
MKTVGLLGGMSWESTACYYKTINEGIKCALGGLHSAKIAMVSVDFYEIEQLQHKGEWGKTASILSSAAQSIESAGADFLLICTNTMHKVSDEIQTNISIPLIHIADATAQVLQVDGITKVGLLGTRFTMEQDFYKNQLIHNFNIDVIVPDSDQQTIIHDVIYNELCLGIINDDSKKQYLNIISTLFKQGAQAIILGCTEITLLVKQIDTNVPLYDTTQIHANAAVKMALG